jgi:hypothetical protein
MSHVSSCMVLPWPVHQHQPGGDACSYLPTSGPTTRHVPRPSPGPCSCLLLVSPTLLLMAASRASIRLTSSSLVRCMSRTMLCAGTRTGGHCGVRCRVRCNPSTSQCQPATTHGCRLWDVIPKSPGMGEWTPSSHPTQSKPGSPGHCNLVAACRLSHAIASWPTDTSDHLTPPGHPHAGQPPTHLDSDIRLLGCLQVSCQAGLLLTGDTQVTGQPVGLRLLGLQGLV